MDSEGLRSRECFEDIARGLFEAARVTGLELELAMVDFPGLDLVRQQLSKPEARAWTSSWPAPCRPQSHAGAMATRLSPDRFALVRAKARPSPDDMAQRLTRATAVQADAHVVPIDGGVAPGARPEGPALRPRRLPARGPEGHPAAAACPRR